MPTLDIGPDDFEREALAESQAERDVVSAAARVAQQELLLAAAQASLAKAETRCKAFRKKLLTSAILARGDNPSHYDLDAAIALTQPVTQPVMREVLKLNDKTGEMEPTGDLEPTGEHEEIEPLKITFGE